VPMPRIKRVTRADKSTSSGSLRATPASS
jgi:hypothetical protein